ncbi:MAG: hypothetical protein ACI9FG_000668 [Crocinitomicaceae bacterium]|jgi:hypothetical protein
MPLTLTITEGAIPHDKVKEAIKQLTDSMLSWHQLTGNRIMTPNITANVAIVPKGQSFSGGEEFCGVWIEWKVPSFAFASREIQKGFGQNATDIIHTLSGGKQRKDYIYFNVVHTVDGAWNLDGNAQSNEELGAAISRG